MYRLSLLAALLLALPTVVHAQRPTGGQPGTQQTAQGVVTGSVVDDVTGNTIPSATVSVWSAADSSLVTGAITDLDGVFRIEGLRPGAYYVRVSFVGYASRYLSDIALRPGALQADLGTVRLNEDTSVLGEVEVAAERAQVEVGIDRTTYNVEDQVIAKTGSATDILQTVPSIEVDADGNISLRGNQNVAVLINGKPSPVRGEFLATFLRQLPGSSVERVEVIPNPSAKYEPDGMSGIINIVLKESTDLGFGGGIIAGVGSRGDGNASTSVTYGKGKWNLGANYGLRYDKRDPSGDTYRLLYAPGTILDETEDGDRTSLSHLLSTNADYQLNRQNSVSASALVSLRGGDETENSISYLTQQDGTPISTTSFSNAEDESGFNMDYRVGFRRVIESSRHELNVEGRYNYSQNDGLDTFSQQASLTGTQPQNAPASGFYRNQQDGDNQDFSFQVDYMRPLGEDAKMEAGYKGSLETIYNDFYADTLTTNGYQPLVAQNNTFDYDQLINAAYLIYGRSLGKFATQIGVRAEQARTKFDLLNDTAEPFDNDYISFFPSAFVTYAPKEGSTFRVSYSRRINRPRTRALNPFERRDANSSFVGNPSLKPEYTDAYEVGYTQFTRRASVTLTPFYRRTTDVIERLRVEDPNTGFSTTTFTNFATSESYGIELIGTLRVGAVNMVLSANGNRVVADGSNVGDDLASDAFQWGGRANVSWSIRPGLDLQAFGFYRAPSEVPQGRISSFSMTDVSLRQRLLGDKASVSVRVSDVLDQSGFHFETDSAIAYQESSRRWGGRTAYLTFTYNFGRQPRNTNNRNRGENQGGEFEDVGIGTP